MKHATGLAIALTGLALLGSIAAITPAGAYECKARVTATSGVRRPPGARPPRPGRPNKSCPRARAKWSDLVRQKYGSRFANWAASDSRRQRSWITATHLKCEVSAKLCRPLE